MQQQYYDRCPTCGKFTLHVRGSSHEVPHMAHLAVVLTLWLLIHPIAGGLWGVAWTIHAVANENGGWWTCTECGQNAICSPPRALPPRRDH